jgi:S-formylglutathione hydrolase FrmB
MKRFMLFLLLLTTAHIGLAPTDAADSCHELIPFEDDLSRLDRHVIDGVPVNVLKPSDYPAPGVQYPVLYLLHGGNPGGEGAWLAATDLIEFTQGMTGDNGVLVVLPRTGAILGTNLDWGDGINRGSSFFMDTLIPFIDSTYKTTPARSHRALAGYSSGGYVAAYLAARHPDIFGAAAPFSGLTDITFGSPEGLGVIYPPFITAYGAVCLGNTQPFPICPPQGELCIRSINPTDLAPNLGGVALDVYTGNGIPCEGDVDRLDDQPGPYKLLEPASARVNENFHRALVTAGVAHTTHFESCGTHDFHHWQRWLHSWWQRMMSSIGHAAPHAFDYRFADKRASVWNWTFETDPARAPEFLDVADASCSGLGLTGSGSTTITTASCFDAGEAVVVNDHALTADDAGRITFTVDLGPAHEHQQYTPIARALEAAGGYWTSKTVALKGGDS